MSVIFRIVYLQFCLKNSMLSHTHQLGRFNQSVGSKRVVYFVNQIRINVAGDDEESNYDMPKCVMYVIYIHTCFVLCVTPRKMCDICVYFARMQS